ncbi:hypothetical protein [Aeromonas enteropelogenes]|uniref:Uncharacterized protein n=1 Tax=Aeromonas enteropelogenes TaxID=29489 RepID=A0ABU9JD04_AEREN
MAKACRLITQKASMGKEHEENRAIREKGMQARPALLHGVSLKREKQKSRLLRGGFLFQQIDQSYQATSL